MSGTGARSNSNELERLLLRMSRKDEAAFEALHAATKRKLFSTVLLVVRRRHLAEEILQEAYVRIWLNAGAYRPALGSPMLWMITIARNLSIDAVRRPAREFNPGDQALSIFAADAPTALETIEIREDEASAIDRQKNVFVALQALD